MTKKKKNAAAIHFFSCVLYIRQLVFETTCWEVLGTKPTGSLPKKVKIKMLN